MLLQTNLSSIFVELFMTGLRKCQMWQGGGEREREKQNDDGENGVTEEPVGSRKKTQGLWGRVMRLGSRWTITSKKRNNSTWQKSGVTKESLSNGTNGQWENQKDLRDE